MIQTNCSNSDIEIRGIDGLCYNSSHLSDTTTLSTICPGPDTFPCSEFTDLNTSFRNHKTVIGYWNETLTVENGVESRLTTDEYFYHYVLRFYEDEYSAANLGYPSWGLALCLLLAWIMVFLCCKPFP